MSLNEIHNRPIAFWSMALVAVVSFLWAIWTHFENKPTREISYEWQSRVIISAYSSERLRDAFKIEAMRNGNIYETALKIWNSGNTDIDREHFANKIKINFPKDSVNINHRIQNLNENFLDGDVRGEFVFSKLYPNSGIMITFLNYEKDYRSRVEGLRAWPKSS